MRTMNCRNVRREIEEAGSAHLLSATAIAHLEACVPCEKLSRQQTNLQAIIADLGTVEVPGDFDFRLRARLAGDQRGQVRSGSFGSFSFGLRSAVVAALLLLIGSAVGFVALKSGSDNPLAGGNPVAPKPGASDAGVTQIDVAKTPTPTVVGDQATGRAPGSPGSMIASVPSGRRPRGNGLKHELATLRTNRSGTRDQSGTRAPVLTRDNEIAESYPTAAFPINASH